MYIARCALAKGAELIFILILGMHFLQVDSKSEKEEDKEEGGVKWHRTERRSTFVQRALRLPESANMDDIKARYDNGVLMLDVPKKSTNGKEAGKRITVN